MNRYDPVLNDLRHCSDVLQSLYMEYPWTSDDTDPHVALIEAEGMHEVLSDLLSKLRALTGEPPPEPLEAEGERR